MVIQHNIAAINSERMHKIVSGKLAKSSEKLSSGYQINRAADNAAGLSISEKLRFQIRGLDRGSANIEEGVGYCQVADGALNEIHAMLQRMNELSIQAANGTNSDADRSYINDEIQAMKTEIDRICITTKYNDEFIFRCEDKITNESKEVYNLKFSGYPEDLYIYNDSYDDKTNIATYGGVAFRGKRYAWAGIDPNMYDTATKKFRAGKYSLRADDGTVLTLICANGSEPPQVSREFLTTASKDGIYVNDELITWDKVRTASGLEFNPNKILNQDYYFDYHGVTVSFMPDEMDSFEDVMSKISGTVWNSTYRMPTEQTALFADFSNTTVPVKDTDQIKEYLSNNGAVPKYILRAGDGTNSTFDGIWLEEADINGQGKGTEVSGSKKSWSELGITNWDNLSEDIWNDKIYQYLYEYSQGQDQESFEFKFQVINEISKDSVIDALDNVLVNCANISSVNHAEAKFDTSQNANVVSTQFIPKGQLSLQDEYELGRNFATEKDTIQPEKGLELDITTSATIPLSVKYTSTIGGQPYERTYALDSTSFDAMVDRLVDTIKKDTGLDSSSNTTLDLLDIINERYANGASNPTEFTLAGVLGSTNITGGGGPTYFEDVVEIDTSNFIYTKKTGLPGTGTEFACGKIDFSGLGTSYQMADLIGLGFNSTCQTCSNHYSIQFTTEKLTPGISSNWQDVVVGGNTYRCLQEKSGGNYTLYIDVMSMQPDVKNGVDFTNTLVELIDSDEMNFAFHFTQYATKKGEAILYSFDNRPEYVVDGKSTATNADFEPFAHDMKTTLDVNFDLKDTTAPGLTMGFKYQYNISNLFAPDRLEIEANPDPDGKYIMDPSDPTGKKYILDDKSGAPTYAIHVKGLDTGMQSIDEYLTAYIKDTVLTDIVATTKVGLYSDRYATGRVQAEAYPNKALVTQHDTPRQILPNPYRHEPSEKAEILTIQCSSNVIDNIEIEKQKLSVYRMGLRDFKTLTETQATKGIDMVGEALQMVSTIRSRFGAYQNRLEHAYDINRNTHENTQHGESVIRDTEMAGEMVKHSNNSILHQAGMSMLAQANQKNQGVLALF